MESEGLLRTKKREGSVTEPNLGPLTHAQQSLSTDEGKCSVYCRRQTGSPRQLTFKKPDLPSGFQQSIFKGQVREGRLRVCDQLMHNSLIG